MNFKIEQGYACLDYAGTVKLSEISFINKKDKLISHLFKPNKTIYRIVYFMVGKQNMFYAGFDTKEERDKVYDMMVNEIMNNKQK